MAIKAAESELLKVGFSLFFCDSQPENAEIAPFFVHLNEK